MANVLTFNSWCYLQAFGRLRTSVKKLSKVVSEEVPGTLYSLKLSSRELNDLTRQLSDLRCNIVPCFFLLLCMVVAGFSSCC